MAGHGPKFLPTTRGSVLQRHDPLYRRVHPHYWQAFRFAFYHTTRRARRVRRMPLHSSPESAPRQTVPGGVLTALTARLGAVAAVGLGRVKSAIDLRGSQQPWFMDPVAVQQT